MAHSAGSDVNGQGGALPLVLTMGEPAGIGGEITLKAWAARHDAALAPFFIIDDPDRLSDLSAALGLAVPVRIIHAPEEAMSVFSNALPVLSAPLGHAVVPGHPQAAHARHVRSAIERAVAYAMDGRAAGIVTNPIQKKTLYDAGFRHPGHTEFLAELTGGDPVMMLSCPSLRVVPVTVHLPLAAVPGALTLELIVEKGTLVADALTRDFGIDRPRLAIAALNPHGGEDGSLGHEEQDIIEPAAEALRQKGIDMLGPLPADSLFHAAARARYDAVLCMYHDQALIPLKTIDFDRGVNITLGLPIVRTSPDHGTALDIASQGRANAASLIEAIRLAGRMARTRAAGRT